MTVEAVLAGGRRIDLTARPPEAPRARRRGAPPVLFLPALHRAGPLLEPDGGSERVDEAVARFRAALGGRPEQRSSSAGASALVAGIDACHESGLSGVVFLIEEPELFLRPQTQRYLYRRLRALAAAGNQVLYSTHAPAFLNVARLEELVLVRYSERRGTHLVQPEALEADEAFRVVSEFDAERSELFLARSAMLVEGRTEKLVLPTIFTALGHDADRAQVSVEQPIPQEVELNRLIARIAGRNRVVVLEPDFEGVTGLRGHANKPERAWNHFSRPGAEVPEPLARAVRLALDAAG
jgi:hypothetical protein